MSAQPKLHPLLKAWPLETRDRLLLIQAFHTFPDDCAIVKSESRFELP